MKLEISVKRISQHLNISLSHFLTVFISLYLIPCSFAQQGVWIKKNDFGGSSRLGAVGFSIGNYGYIGLGIDTFRLLKKDFWQYDPVKNSWTQKASFPGNARQDAVGFSIGEKGYVATGYDSKKEKNDFWEYDPAENVWKQKANFSGEERFGAIGFSIGSKGYIGTGLKGRTSFKDFWEYDPSADTWTQKANFGSKPRLGAVGFSIGSKGYVGTGWDDPAALKDFWEYNPLTNLWIRKANFGGSARYAAVGFSIGSYGYIGAGDDGECKHDFWEYDTVADTWTQRASFGGAGRWGAAGFAVNGKGYIGTGFTENQTRQIYHRDFWQFTPPQLTDSSFAEKNQLPVIVNCYGGIIFSSRTEEGVSNINVFLYSNQNILLQSAATDSAGFFQFSNLSSNQNYTVRIDDSDSGFINQKNIFLADGTGRIVRAASKNNHSFLFENLPPDFSKLPALSVEDVSLNKFSVAGNFYHGKDRMPLENTRVFLKNEKGEVVQRTFTNAFGSFVFVNLSSENNFTIALDVCDPKLALSEIYLTTKNGTAVFNQECSMFRFQILASDNHTLSLLKIDDSQLIADLKGKLYADKTCKIPIANTRLSLMNAKGVLVKTVFTDSSGNFLFTHLPADKLMLTLLDKNDPSLAGKNVFLADMKNNVHGMLKSASGKFFRYEILTMEEPALAAIYFDDPWLRVFKLQSVSQKDSVLQITENIYYDYGKWDLLPSAVLILNKVVDVMKKNTGIVVEIISHTDSRGTNKFNLSLSQKRAQAAVDYVISKGIVKGKISGRGMGETQLVNRCKDGTECPEEEHSQNRRTEFKIKQSE